jgi:hypothetical protein
VPTLAPFPTRSRESSPGSSPVSAFRAGTDARAFQRSGPPLPRRSRAGFGQGLQPSPTRRGSVSAWRLSWLHPVAEASGSPRQPGTRRRPSAAPTCRVLPSSVPGVPAVTAETRRIDVCSPIRLFSKTVVSLRAGSEQAEPKSLLLAVDRARHPSFGKDTYPGRADDALSGFALSAPCWNAVAALVTVRGPPRPSTCQVVRPL